MKYLVICGPMVRFLIKNFQIKLPPSLALGDTLKRFFNGEILKPSNAQDFIEILSNIQHSLSQTDMLYKKAVLRKYVGNGLDLKGLFNILTEKSAEIYIYCYSPGEIYNIKDQISSQFPEGLDNSEIKIIAPLNLDENEDIYEVFHSHYHLPVYPLTYNKFASNWVKNIVFNPLTKF